MAAVFVALSACALASCGTFDDQEEDLPAISVTGARIYASKGADTAYLTMSITSSRADTLLRASTEPSVAASISFTSGFAMPTPDPNDPNPETIPIPIPGETITEIPLPAAELISFGATGYGVVLDATEALLEAETATIHLELAKAGTVDIVAPITIEQ